MIGKEFRVLLNEKDEFVDVENWDEILAAMKLPPAMAKSFSKETIAQTIRQGMLQSLPDHPVKPGDRWPMETSFSFSGIGKAVVKGDHLLKSVGLHDGVRCAEIAIEAKMSFDSSSRDQAGAQSPEARMNMKIEDTVISGTMWFDLALGMMREGEYPQNFAMTMNDPSDPKKTARIPVKQLIHFKLNKVEDLK